MGKSSGSADPSGMYEAMASAQAASQAYQLGEQQLQWAKQVWGQEQPLVDQSTQQQILLSQAETQTMQEAQQFAQEQQAQYLSTYAPLEQAFVGQAENWASPGNIALVQGQAQSNVAEQSNAALNTAEQQLQSYGINPSSPKYAGLLIGQQAIEGAGEAAAGTTAAQNLKLQQLGLESQAINTGRGLVNSSGQLSQVGTQAAGTGAGAASGAASTSQQNLSTGSNAQTAPTAWYNAGTNAMNAYVNAVNGYNQAQLGYAQLNAQSGMAGMSGLGSLAGGVLGLLEKGGAVRRYANGGNVGSGDVPPAIPMGGTPGGGVPIEASPSGGVQSDDVDAKLTAGEFVIPKDVAMWKGHEYFAKQIDQARAANQQFSNRDDIGGEPIMAERNPNPPFISRPALHTGSTAATPPAIAVMGQQVPLQRPMQQPALPPRVRAA